MDNLRVPAALRRKLDDDACEGLLTMFAEAHRIAVDSFERRLDVHTERVDRRLAELRADLLKWSFLFWISQLAAIAGMLAFVLSRI
jgi:hypothetical protein